MSDGMDCTCAAYSESECCCGSDWNPQEVIDLRQQLASRQKHVLMLRDALDATLNMITRAQPSVDTIHAARKALAATEADLGGLILCEKEPVAWYDKHGMITHDPFEGAVPLHRAAKEQGK